MMLLKTFMFAHDTRKQISRNLYLRSFDFLCKHSLRRLKEVSVKKLYIKWVEWFQDTCQSCQTPITIVNEIFDIKANSN